MNDSMCAKCDMPMMEYERSIACVFCKPEENDDTTEHNEEFSSELTEEKQVTNGDKTARNTDKPEVNDNPDESTELSTTDIKQSNEKVVRSGTMCIN